MLPDYGVNKYDIGTGFGHFGIAVEDVSSFFLKWRWFSLMQTTAVLHFCFIYSKTSAFCRQCFIKQCYKNSFYHFCHLYIENHVNSNNSICVF